MEMQSTSASRPDANRATAPGPLSSLEGIATTTICGEGCTIYRCSDRASHWYRIVAGAARTCALRADGRRQIVDFLMPDDVFGFDAFTTHCLSAEAIVPDTRVARYPLQLVERLAETDPQFARYIREMAFASIRRLQTRMVILGQTSAVDRVGAFLLEMADRCVTPSNAIALPMSRYDIADYLAMAVETVSRALTELKARGVITLEGVRSVRLCDRHALERRVDARRVN